MGNWKTDLELSIDTTVRSKTHNYDFEQVLEPQTYDGWYRDFYNRSGHIIPSFKNHITTRICKHRHFLSPNGYDHLLVLDCDSYEKKEEAIDYLKRLNGISYDVYISSYNDTKSSNRYWVICDYISNFKDVFALLSTVPGVDPLYVRFVENKKMLNLRAYPKTNCMPIFDYSYLNRDADHRFINWKTCFWDYWNSEEFINIIRKINDREDDRGRILAIGSHFDKTTYNKIQSVINKDVDVNILCESIEEKIMLSMNATYGMEIE